MHEQQTCRECGLARLPADRNDGSPRRRGVVVYAQDFPLLPVHQLDRLTDQNALRDAARRLDPSDDLLAESLLLTAWYIRRHRYFPPPPTATLRKSRCASAASRCTRPGPRASGGWAESLPATSCRKPSRDAGEAAMTGP